MLTVVTPDGRTRTAWRDLALTLALLALAVVGVPAVVALASLAGLTGA